MKCREAYLCRVYVALSLEWISPSLSRIPLAGPLGSDMRVVRLQHRNRARYINSIFFDNLLAATLLKLLPSSLLI
jgi:hypothetical protein